MRLRYALLPSILLIGGLSSCSEVQSPASGDAISAAQLQPSIVTGTLSYRERIALTPGYTLGISLRDVSIADRAAPIIAETSRKLNKEQVPLSFELKFDPEKVKPRGRYSVRATLVDQNGKLAWTTDTAHLIRPGQPSQKLGMLSLVRVASGRSDAEAGAAKKTATFQCDSQRFKAEFSDETVTVSFDGKRYTLPQVKAASGAKYERKDEGNHIMFWNKGDEAMLEINKKSYKGCTFMKGDKSGAALIGAEWRVEDIAAQGIIDRSNVTLRFDNEGRLSGSTGCNNYGADYEVKDGTITFKAIAVTRKACPPALMNQEQKFLSILDSKLSYEMSYDDAFVLTAEDGQTIKAMRSSEN